MGLDVDGDGKVDCKDFHDACFLAYPVQSSNKILDDADFRNMQERSRALVALEDLPLEVKEKLQFPSSGSRLDSKTLEAETQSLAANSGVCPNELRRAAYELVLKDRAVGTVGFELNID